MDYFDDINSCKYIYLGKIEEPKDNTLRLIIEEAVTNSEEQSIEIGTREISGVHAIQVTENSRVFEVRFEDYIGYSVLSESFAIPDDDEKFKGRLFCIYDKSNYLEYIKKASFACDDHPGPFQHYGFNCLNHIVDVVSVDEPIVKLIAPNATN